MAGAEAMPNGNLCYRNKPICVVIVKYPWLSAATAICLYACDKSNLVNDSPLASAEKTSSGVGRGYVGTFKCGLMVTLKSDHQRSVPKIIHQTDWRSDDDLKPWTRSQKTCYDLASSCLPTSKLQMMVHFSCNIIVWWSTAYKSYIICIL